MDDIVRLALRISEANGFGYSRRRRRTNNKRGVIKEGSCTDKVLAVLTDEAPRAIAKSEIVTKSECKPKSVDWALYYLRSIKKITCVSAMDNRSPLYLRYKLADSRD